MKCAFARHLSSFRLNKCWCFSLLRSWLVFYMVSIEIPLPEPRIKMRGRSVIEYILCELLSIIWILPAFELHCWTHLLLCCCSSISREMNVPSWAALTLGEGNLCRAREPSRCQPSTTRAGTPLGVRATHRQEEGDQRLWFCEGHCHKLLWARACDFYVSGTQFPNL